MEKDDSIITTKMLFAEFQFKFFQFFFFLISHRMQESDMRLLDSNDSFLTNREMYRHSVTLTAVYCVAYMIVFVVGLIGNSFVIAVVLRSPRMRTVTNFFIVNLAVADILVIVFCLPATLMSNIFVREYPIIHFIQK